MVFEKVQKSSLTDRVTEKIYDKIVSGEIAPGERLPSETELSEQLGVGRPTIREALNRLIGMGLVVRGDYTMIVAPGSSMSTRAGLAPLFLEKWEGSELYQARILIEEDIVGLAIENAKPEDIEALRQINAKLLNENLSESNYYDVDMEFHTHLANLSGNQIMIEISRIISNMFQRYKAQVAQLYEVQKMTYEDHACLIDAIENQDFAEARTIIQCSFRGSENALKELNRKNTEK